LNDLLALPDTLIVVARESDGRALPYVMVDGRGWIHGFNGHVDLGTGIRTALAQIVAEELDADPSRVRMVLGDTGRTPNQGATIASDTIQTTAVPCVPPPRRPAPRCSRWLRPGSTSRSRRWRQETARSSTARR
jgi:nicotinate dehydrogenase subunit B